MFGNEAGKAVGPSGQVVGVQGSVDGQGAAGQRRRAGGATNGVDGRRQGTPAGRPDCCRRCGRPVRVLANRARYPSIVSCDDGLVASVGFTDIQVADEPADRSHVDHQPGEGLARPEPVTGPLLGRLLQPPLADAVEAHRAPPAGGEAQPTRFPGWRRTRRQGRGRRQVAQLAIGAADEPDAAGGRPNDVETQPSPKSVLDPPPEKTTAPTEHVPPM